MQKSNAQQSNCQVLWCNLIHHSPSMSDHIPPQPVPGLFHLVIEPPTCTWGYSHLLPYSLHNHAVPVPGLFHLWPYSLCNQYPSYSHLLTKLPPQQVAWVFQSVHVFPLPHDYHQYLAVPKPPSCTSTVNQQYLAIPTCGHTPSTTSTRTRAPSQSLTAVDTSLEKSMWPGESIRFTRYSDRPETDDSITIVGLHAPRTLRLNVQHGNNNLTMVNSNT